MSKKVLKVLLAVAGGVVVYYGLSYGWTLLQGMGPGKLDQDAYVAAQARDTLAREQGRA